LTGRIRMQTRERNNEFVAFVALGEASFVDAVSKDLERNFDAPSTVFRGLDVTMTAGHRRSGDRP
jgi:hypothetical protein